MAGGALFAALLLAPVQPLEAADSAPGSMQAAAASAEMLRITTPVWPPPGVPNLAPARAEALKPVFEALVAYGQQAAAARANPAFDAWEGMRQRFSSVATAMGSRMPAEFVDGYLVPIQAQAERVPTRADPASAQWQQALRNTNAALGIAAISTEVWLQRAQLLLAAGLRDEATRDLFAARATASFQGGDRHPSKKEIDRVYAELILPESVRAVPQGSFSSLNLQRARLAFAEGKPLADALRPEVVAAFENYGARLQAARQIADPAQARDAVALVHDANAPWVAGLAYPVTAWPQLPELEGRLANRLQDNPQEALRLADEILQRAPTPATLLARGLALDQLGRKDDARAELKAVVKVSPNLKAASDALARMDREVAEAAKAQTQQKITALLVDARQKLKAGDAAGGDALLGEALKLDANSLEALLLRGELEIGRENAPAAYTALELARRKHPDSPRVAALRTYLDIFRGQRGQAAATVKAALQKSPGDPELEALGQMNAVMQVEMPQMAGEAKNRLAQLDQKLGGRTADTPLFFLARATLRQLSGDRAGALADLKAYLERTAFEPPSVQLQVGQLALALGDKTAARQYLERASKAGLPQAKAMLERL